jgi:hypothetical protein
VSSTGHMTHRSTSSRRHRRQIQRKHKSHRRRSGCGGPAAEVRHVWHDSGCAVTAAGAMPHRLCTGSAPVRCKRFLAHRASWGDAVRPTTFRTIPQHHSPRSNTTPHDPTLPTIQHLSPSGSPVGSLWRSAATWWAPCASGHGRWRRHRGHRRRCRHRGCRHRRGRHLGRRRCRTAARSRPATKTWRTNPGPIPGSI